MKKLILIGLLVISQAWLFSQEPPTTPPTCSYDEGGNAYPEGCVMPPAHTEPMAFCTPHKGNDGKRPCECLHNQPNGCKEGKMDTEMKNCNSWCWKKYCMCCSS